jgi:hypothetical protein
MHIVRFPMWKVPVQEQKINHPLTTYLLQQADKL